MQRGWMGVRLHLGYGELCGRLLLLLYHSRRMCIGLVRGWHALFFANCFYLDHLWALVPSMFVVVL